MTIRTVIADDDAEYLRIMKRYLSFGNDFEIVGLASDGAEAIEIIESHPCDLVVSDLHMPKRSGLEVLSFCRSRPQPVAFVAMTAFDSDDALFRTLKNGAKAYFNKTDDVRSIIECLKSAHSGKTLLSPQYVERLVGVRKPMRNQWKLSDSEVRLLDLLANGYSNREIAQQMHYAFSTVKNKVSALMLKTETRSRTELVALWLRT